MSHTFLKSVVVFVALNANTSGYISRGNASTSFTTIKV